MQVEVASIVQRMMFAGERWESALDAHALAPPDAGFPVRLRTLSIAAAEQAAAFELAAQGGLGWRSRTIDGEFSLAPELTPGRNRPGPPELWERFDAATAALAAALAGRRPRTSRSRSRSSPKFPVCSPPICNALTGQRRASRGSDVGTLVRLYVGWRLLRLLRPLLVAAVIGAAVLALHGGHVRRRVLRPARWFAEPGWRSATSSVRWSVPSCPPSADGVCRQPPTGACGSAVG